MHTKYSKCLEDTLATMDVDSPAVTNESLPHILAEYKTTKLYSLV